jgi:hypothetical protein
MPQPRTSELGRITTKYPHRHAGLISEYTLSSNARLSIRGFGDDAGDDVADRPAYVLITMNVPQNVPVHSRVQRFNATMWDLAKLE